jgi:hypothetical protein
MHVFDMQEKRNTWLIISLVTTISVILLLLWFKQTDNSVQVSKKYYNDFDLKSIDRVVVASKNGTTDLRFQGYRWRVNDLFDADRNLIEVLFATLKQAQPKRPVANQLKDSVVQDLRKNGVKVSCFAGEKELVSFYSGGNEQKTQGIFLRSDSNEPHIMVIPGYRVYVPGIFELPPSGWREKLVFNFNWQNFTKLEAHYKNPAGDFEILMDKNQVYIKNLDPADTAKLNTYLDQVSLLTVEEYIEKNPTTDSLAKTSPFLNLIISDIGNREYRLSIFATGKQIFGVINGEHWATFDKNRVLPLLRPKEFFLKR